MTSAPGLIGNPRVFTMLAATTEISACSAGAGAACCVRGCADVCAVCAWG